MCRTSRHSGHLSSPLSMSAQPSPTTSSPSVSTVPCPPACSAARACPARRRVHPPMTAAGVRAVAVPRLGARKRVRALRAPRYRYLRNVFVEIIMCVRVANVILLTLMCALGGVVLLFSLPLASPGAPESVDYRPMCFEPNAPVVLQREPTDCHGCQFSSPNLPDGWSINFFTGDITGPAEAGDQGSIEVLATTEAGVLNATVVYEIATRFAQPIGLKVVQEVTGAAFVYAVLYFLFQPQPR